MNSVLKELRRKLDTALVQRESLQTQIDETQMSLGLSEQRVEKSLKAREVITHVAKQTQGRLELQLSELVSMCLATVFPDPYGFKVVFEQRRNTLECDLFLEKDGELFKPIDSTGGGVLDILAFGLRVALWSLRPGRPTFILDEPAKFLSPDLHDKFSMLCKELCDKLKIQIIMVSHSEDIVTYADKVFKIQNGQLVES